MPHRGLQRSRTPKQRNLRVLHVWWAAANWLRSDSRRAAVSLLQSCLRLAESGAAAGEPRRTGAATPSTPSTREHTVSHTRSQHRHTRCSSRARSRAPSRRTRALAPHTRSPRRRRNALHRASPRQQLVHDGADHRARRAGHLDAAADLRPPHGARGCAGLLGVHVLAAASPTRGQIGVIRCNYDYTKFVCHATSCAETRRCAR